MYESEDVLRWEDIDWKNKRIVVRATVGKATKRKSGNQRFVPITDLLMHWLKPYKSNTGMVVPVLHHDHSQWMKKLHAATDIPALHNGLRRSAISYYLAAHPETGIGQLARWCGSSEATIKRHYLEVLLPEVGEQWFVQTLIISRDKLGKAMRKLSGECTAA